MYEPTPTTRLAASYKSSVDPKLEGTPSFNNLDPLLREALAAADLLGTEVDVDFKVPAIAQGGVYTEFGDRWSATGDVVWINMSEFGVTRVSVGQESITVREDDFRDAWMGSAGVKYRYAEDRAVSIGAMYFTSPISDGKRNIALPVDRVFGVGAGLERPCLSFHCKMTLNYFDLGDGDLVEDGGPRLGRIAGSFSKNWAVMLDIQLKKIF
jgi:long-chain fatty acid transport protein